jgi:hypothetical protein
MKMEKVFAGLCPRDEASTQFQHLAIIEALAERESPTFRFRDPATGRPFLPLCKYADAAGKLHMKAHCIAEQLEYAPVGFFEELAHKELSIMYARYHAAYFELLQGHFATQWERLRGDDFMQMSTQEQNDCVKEQARVVMALFVPPPGSRSVIFEWFEKAVRICSEHVMQPITEAHVQRAVYFCNHLFFELVEKLDAHPSIFIPDAPSAAFILAICANATVKALDKIDRTTRFIKEVKENILNKKASTGSDTTAQQPRDEQEVQKEEKAADDDGDDSGSESDTDIYADMPPLRAEEEEEEEVPSPGSVGRFDIDATARRLEEIAKEQADAEQRIDAANATMETIATILCTGERLSAAQSAALAKARREHEDAISIIKGCVAEATEIKASLVKERKRYFHM